MPPPLSPPRNPPHIRLNSGQEDLLTSTHEPSYNNTPGYGQQSPGLRSLTPQRPSPPSSSGLGTSIYNTPAVQDSAELLLPPAKSMAHRLRDEESQSPSRPMPPSGMSSRRSSWSSGASNRDSRDSAGTNPFDDSRAPSRAGSDDDVNTQTVSEKYNILPSAGLLLFPEDVEKDDWLHNPDPNDKNSRDCDIFTKRGFVNVGSLTLITLGVLMLFIGYPVLYVLYICKAPHK